MWSPWAGRVWNNKYAKPTQRFSKTTSKVSVKNFVWLWKLNISSFITCPIIYSRLSGQWLKIVNQLKFYVVFVFWMKLWTSTIFEVSVGGWGWGWGWWGWGQNKIWLTNTMFDPPPPFEKVWGGQLETEVPEREFSRLTIFSNPSRLEAKYSIRNDKSSKVKILNKYNKKCDWKMCEIRSGLERQRRYVL